MIWTFLLTPLLWLSCPEGLTWGFYMHREINRIAVFTLPPEMIPFYKRHISELVNMSVDPDRRRHVMEDEPPRHYIDLDLYVYPDSLRVSWQDACSSFGEDTLLARGIVPWHIDRLRRRLTSAFRVRDGTTILKVSSELGHYIADAHVPLHTTANYDGEETDQAGIHAFWESRLPELFFEEYDHFTGRAEYLDSPFEVIWNVIIQAHKLVDTVLITERQLRVDLGQDQGRGFDYRGTGLQAAYNRKFAREYHRRLNGMVERQFRSSVRMTGNIWYTCWVDAGQPPLETLKVGQESPGEWRMKYDSLRKADSLRFAADPHTENSNQAVWLD